MLLLLRRRRELAWNVLVAFVAGFLVAPCLHNLHHAADHEHGPDGFSVRWSDQPGSQLEAHQAAHRQGRPHFHSDSPHSAASTGTGPTPRSRDSSGRSESPGGTEAEVLDLADPGRTSHGLGAAGHFGVATTPVAVFVLLEVPASAAAVRPDVRRCQICHCFPFAASHPRGPPAWS